MITYRELTTSAGDQVVEAAKLVQERLVEGLTSFDDFTKQVAAKLPAMPELPKLPVPDAFPSFTDIVEANAALVERLVQANKELLVAVADAIATPADADA